MQCSAIVKVSLGGDTVFFVNQGLNHSVYILRIYQPTISKKKEIEKKT